MLTTKSFFSTQQYVRWLSKVNVVNHVFEMKCEIQLFLEIQENKYLVVYFEDESWNKRVAYLADIFDQLNKFNLTIQGRETHVFFFNIVFGPFFPNCRYGNGKPILETSLCLKNCVE